MPLRCLDPSANGSILAFDLSPGEWRALELENRKTRHLKMTCRDAQVTLKRSRRGTPFFAHKSVGECSIAPETEAHLRLKRIAIEAARMHGWDAETEVAGEIGEGDRDSGSGFSALLRMRALTRVCSMSGAGMTETRPLPSIRVRPRLSWKGGPRSPSGRYRPDQP